MSRFNLKLGGRVAMLVCASAGALLAANAAFSQQTGAPAATPAAGAAPGAAPAGAPRGGGGGGGGFSLVKPNFDITDNTGWVSIFNGRDLTGWDGDKAYWSVKDGSIFAESTCEKPTGTIYIDWTGGVAGDFDLKFETKLTGTANGGAQYRSWIVGTPGKPGAGGGAPGGAAGAGRAGAPAAGGAPGAGAAGGAGRGGAAGAPAGGAPGGGALAAAGGAGRAGAPGGAPGAPGGAPGGAAGAGGGGGGRAAPGPCPSGQPRGTTPDRVAQNKWYLDGPQYDFDNAPTYPGQFYEQGTGRAIAGPPGQYTIAQAGKPVQMIAALQDINTVKTWWKKDDWNQALVVVRGHTYVHYLNGHVTTIFTDDDPNFYQSSGMIGFEIESTGQAYMRNIYLRKYN